MADAELYKRLAAEGVEVVGKFHPALIFDALSAVLRKTYGVEGRVQAELPAETEIA